jgi:hypothetical protein
MVEFIVTRASNPTGIATQQIGTLVDLLNLARLEKWPVVINALDGLWQLKIMDDPKLLAAAKNQYPILFPSRILRLEELQDLRELEDLEE